jgi:hypothetical protein
MVQAQKNRGPSHDRPRQSAKRRIPNALRASLATRRAVMVGVLTVQLHALAHGQ